jgi:hypothetical protein
MHAMDHKAEFSRREVTSMKATLKQIVRAAILLTPLAVMVAAAAPRIHY